MKIYKIYNKKLNKYFFPSHKVEYTKNGRNYNQIYQIPWQRIHDDIKDLELHTFEIKQVKSEKINGYIKKYVEEME